VNGQAFVVDLWLTQVLPEVIMCSRASSEGQGSQKNKKKAQNTAQICPWENIAEILNVSHLLSLHKVLFPTILICSLPN
jgi:hypothetical protein